MSWLEKLDDIEYDAELELETMHKTLNRKHGPDYRKNAPPEYFAIINKQRDVLGCKLKTRMALLSLVNRMSAPDEIKENLF